MKTTAFFFAAAIIASFSLDALAQEFNHGALAENPGALKGQASGAYANLSTGQIHMQTAVPDVCTGKTPFFIFHPNPYSGLYFSYLLEKLGQE